MRAVAEMASFRAHLYFAGAEQAMTSLVAPVAEPRVRMLWAEAGEPS